MSACHRRGQRQHVNECYLYVIMSTNDMSACHRRGQRQHVNECYLYVIMSTNDMSACHRRGQRQHVNECYLYVIMSTNDMLACRSAHVSLFCLCQAVASVPCNDHDVMLMLRDLFSTNGSEWQNVLETQRECGGSNVTSGVDFGAIYANDLRVHDVGKDVYAYMTPVIIVIGLVGNTISLRVFTSKVMQRLSSSHYLVALSASDILVLLTYVFIDWLNRGMIRWPGNLRVPLMNARGACQMYLYVSYTLRFISAWLIVIFAAERFVAVCMPRHRRRFGTKRFANKLIVAVVLIAAVLCLYKPILSEVHETSKEKACTRNRKFNQENFVLDAVYGILITAVPSIVILALNIPILKCLVNWQNGHNGAKIMHREKRIRLEVTIILLAISSCFIFLNLPYFIIWCKQFLQSLNPKTPLVADRISGQLYIARTIFYLNYCVNIFLYMLTGAYYRREIKSMFRYIRKPQSTTQAIEVPGIPP